MKTPNGASGVVGTDEQKAREHVAQRFAKLLAIGAARLLAKDPALLGIVRQGQSPVGHASNRRSITPTIREYMGDAAEAPDAGPEVGVICGEYMTDQAEPIEPSIGSGGPDGPATEEKGVSQLCMPY